MEETESERALKELQEMVEYLQRKASDKESIPPSMSRMMAEIITKAKNSLAARTQPARLIVALHDPVAGMDQKPVVLVGSTVSVTMFVVDHRKHQTERLSVVLGGELGEPSEVIQVVSDEASEYLQQNPELLQSITTNC